MVELMEEESYEDAQVSSTNDKPDLQVNKGGRRGCNPGKSYRLFPKII
jgi:hypothetical protein